MACKRLAWTCLFGAFNRFSFFKIDFSGVEPSLRACTVNPERIESAGSESVPSSDTQLSRSLMSNQSLAPRFVFTSVHLPRSL